MFTGGQVMGIVAVTTPMMSRYTSTVARPRTWTCCAVLAVARTFTCLQVAALNARRIKVGFSGVRVISLKSIASKAYREEYFYAEDATSNIPAFINVS